MRFSGWWGLLRFFIFVLSASIPIVCFRSETTSVSLFRPGRAQREGCSWAGLRLFCCLGSTVRFVDRLG
uniref:Uncharacterized protein n=1 Tax=Salix viminalis TaxID=40686 RepID=A0A6N2MKH1_SALVM